MKQVVRTHILTHSMFLKLCFFKMVLYKYQLHNLLEPNAEVPLRQSLLAFFVNLPKHLRESLLIGHVENIDAAVVSVRFANLQLKLLKELEKDVQMSAEDEQKNNVGDLQQNCPRDVLDEIVKGPNQLLATQRHTTW